MNGTQLSASQINKKIFSNGSWAVFICLLYAVFMLAYVLAPGDGGWMLYADAILKGKRLYSDLHFNQQPLFPLLTTAIRFIAGDKIFVQKLAYVVVPVLYLRLIYLITRYISNEGIKRGLFIMAIFFIAITFEAYRFDDYHPFSGILILASLYLSIKLVYNKISLKQYIFLQAFCIAFLLNIRINDGAALALAVMGFGILRIGFRREIVQGLVFSLIVFGTILTVELYLLNDSYQSWYVNSLESAVRIKGGGDLIFQPGIMFVKSVRFFLEGDYNYRSAILILFSLFVSYVLLKRALNIVIKYAVAIFAFAAIYYSFYRINPYYALAFFVALGVIVAYVMTFIMLFIRINGLYASSSFYKFSPLILYPFLLYCGGSLSSAGHFTDHFFPLAILLVVLLLIFKSSSRDIFFSYFLKYFAWLMLGVLALEAITLRTVNPYSWQSYNVPSFIEKRILVNDSVHGPHLLSRDLANLIQPVCLETKNANELLSIPFSFANYYCRKEPWRNYIQTFFDTSSSEQIEKLIRDISVSPPEYIFYQRQIINLAGHEQLFNGGKRLHQRDLDEFIMKKIDESEWNVVYKSDLYPPSIWLLIKTK